MRDDRELIAKGPDDPGHRLLRNDEVLKIIEQQTDRHLRRVDLRAEDVLRRIMQMAAGDIRRLVTKTGTLRPIQDLEDDVEVLIAGMKISDAGVTEIKITDRLKALALLAQLKFVEENPRPSPGDSNCR